MFKYTGDSKTLYDFTDTNHYRQILNVELDY